MIDPSTGSNLAVCKDILRFTAFNGAITADRATPVKHLLDAEF